MSSKIYITECPRDAMQGIHTHIPTEDKVAYLDQLLKVGFPILDCGSFVSPKAIPQLADTNDVLRQLAPFDSNLTKLLVIVANTKGAEDAADQAKVNYLGFPLSVSETFQQRNTNKSIIQAFDNVLVMRDIAHQAKKELLVYLSMGFGNPYNDPYSATILHDMAWRLIDEGITEIALADTIGTSDPTNIADAFTALQPFATKATFRAHFHSTKATAHHKIQAALKAGCHYFDTALLGFGGCPMATEDLTGNLATETLIKVAEDNGYQIDIDKEAFGLATDMASKLFYTYK